MALDEGRLSSAESSERVESQCWNPTAATAAGHVLERQLDRSVTSRQSAAGGVFKPKQGGDKSHVLLLPACSPFNPT